MPLRSDWSEKSCPIARCLDVVGDPWALLVLRQALSGARRFEQFKAGVGAADNVLASRLRSLVDGGLLRRAPYADGTRTRHEYVLTVAGADLLPVLNAMALWGDTHRPHPDPSVGMQIVHRGCGQVTTSPATCTRCGAALTPESTAWRKSWEDGDVELVGPVP